MARVSLFSVRDIFQDRRKLTVFIVCLLLAAASWLLISLGKVYSTTLIVPVEYVNFPQNKTLLNDVPKQIAVNVSGTGFDLLQYDDHLTQDTLKVNLDNLQISILGEYQRGYLDQSLISKNLQERLNGVLAINRVLSDSINFLFDLKVARVLPVHPKLGYDLKKGFVLFDSIRTSPSEVEVYGALSVLDTMQYLPTENVELGVLDATTRRTVALRRSSYISFEDMDVDSVNVEIPIDQLTEKRFLVQPEFRNVPDSLSLLSFPSGVEVVAQVALSHYEEIDPSGFSLYLDYHDLEGDYKVLPVHLEQWTTKAKNIRVSPQEVEVVLTRIE